MKVLVVCNGNKGKASPFVSEQVDALTKENVDFEIFLKKGKGLIGYLKNYPDYIKKINTFKPDLVHAHYGLSALFANLQWRIPVITTFHGSDVHQGKNKYFSKLAFYLSKDSIFVSPKLQKLMSTDKGNIIPCGVDFFTFYEIPKGEAKKILGLDERKKYILFSSSFNNKIKNAELAKTAINLLETENIELLELSGYTREEVNLLLNASELALLTSIDEGSPQFIKEAMATNTPIVATNVGDVQNLIANMDGCYLTSFDPNEVAKFIKKALQYASNKGKTDTRSKSMKFDNNIIAKEIFQVYNKIFQKYCT